MPSKKQPRVQDLESAVQKLKKKFKDRTDLSAVDYGFREGKRDGPLVVRAFVPFKRDETELEKSETLPKTIDGIDVDVIEGDFSTSDARAGLNHRQRALTLMGGVSCGRAGGGAGTLGVMVIDLSDGSPAMLSNWHVLVGPSGVPGDPILQPAALDGGRPARDIVGRLGRSLLGLGGDAAIAHLGEFRPWLPVVFGSFDPITDARAVTIGETLKKSGRTTGVTEAIVDGIGQYRVRYQTSPGQSELIWVRGFKLVPVVPGNPDDIEVSQGGDSGSVWYDPATNEGVGLHFAGERNSAPAAEQAIACHLADVLDTLNLRMATFEDIIPRAQETVGAEYTPRPDQPYPIWPCFPEWPMPVPPYSWSYRGDRMAPCWPGVYPQSGEVPWPLSPYAMQGAGPEQLSRPIERMLKIWADLKAAIIAKYGPVLAPSAPMSTPVKDPFPYGNPDTFLIPAIRDSDAFRGVRVAYGDFENARTFEFVVGTLSDRLREVGK